MKKRKRGTAKALALLGLAFSLVLAGCGQTAPSGGDSSSLPESVTPQSSSVVSSSLPQSISPQSSSVAASSDSSSASGEDVGGAVAPAEQMYELYMIMDRSRLPTGPPVYMQGYLTDKPPEDASGISPQILFPKDDFAEELAWWVYVFSPYILKEMDFSDTGRYNNDRILETACRYVPSIETGQVGYTQFENGAVPYLQDYSDHILNYIMLIDRETSKLVLGYGYIEDVWPVLESMFGKDIYEYFAKNENDLWVEDNWEKPESRSEIFTYVGRSMERFHFYPREGIFAWDELRRSGDFWGLMPQILAYSRNGDIVTFETAIVAVDMDELPPGVGYLTPQTLAARNADYRYTLQMVEGSNPILLKLEKLN